MTTALHPQLAAHLQRHARSLHRLACGFGRARDADDILQTLYARWWKRMQQEQGWTPPQSHAELFVCVRRVVMDVVAKEKRDRLREDRGASDAIAYDSAEESLHAFERLEWIMAKLPAPLAEALMASLSAGRRNDADVARELGVTTPTYTTRLFKARRAAEELASYYELLPLDLANLMAELSYGGKTRAQVAHELGMLVDELTTKWNQATSVLSKKRGVAAS